MFHPVKRLTLFSLPLLLLTVPTLAQQSASFDIINRIKEEGLNRSQVMQTLSHLTDVIGPRLTASPAMKRANEWTRDTLTSWGLKNAHLEAWGPFGRGWSLEKFSAQIVSPHSIPLIAYPKAWSPGLRGVQTAEVVYVEAKDEKDLEKYRGKLKGAIVLNGSIREVLAHFDSLGVRFTDQQLKEMENAQQRPRRNGETPARPPRPGAGGQPNFMQQLRMAGIKARFFQEEGVALLVDPSTRGDGGTLFVQSATVPPPPSPVASSTSATPGTPPRGGAGGGMRRGPWEKNAPKIIPQMVMAVEHYNRLMRMLAQGEKLRMQVQLDVKFYAKDIMGYNTVAELPGSDLKDQIVMAGAHMDSWHGGTGATDNAAGCAVVMEAVRILKTLNLQPRRTIRIGLWSGEEQGLIGSRAYVTEHLANRPTPSASAAAPGGSAPELLKKPEYEKFAAYFNLDNGTGKIRGIYCQGNEAVRPIFQEWLTPFKDMGASTVTLANTGGTDHQSFDGVGLPGFQFIQDEIEYETRTHHSNQDVFDRIQADDMKQAAVIMATFLYNAAIRDEPLPRKP